MVTELNIPMDRDAPHRLHLPHIPKRRKEEKRKEKIRRGEEDKRRQVEKGREEKRRKEEGREE